MINNDALWTLALGNLKLGRVIRASHKATAAKDLTVIEHSAKRITLARPSGKTVNISRKMVESTYARLVAGETLKRQASAKDGGISYTVAITRGVVMALGLDSHEGLVAWDGVGFVASAKAKAKASA